LIGRAVGKGDLQSLQELLQMRRELKAEAARELFFRDLAEAQRNFPVIRKSVVVMNKPGKGGGIRYRYAPLDEIERQAGPVLARFGFSWTFKSKQSKTMVGAIVEAHHVGGHMEITQFAVPIQDDAYMTAPQKVASALTFAKRYVFINAFGIVTADVDDDGLSAGVRSENGSAAEQERDVTPRQKPQAVPDNATEEVQKLLARMKWMPETTRERYRAQAKAFVDKQDLRSLQGMAQSLTRQIALHEKKEGDQA
jgi:hypothetical protein